MSPGPLPLQTTSRLLKQLVNYRRVHLLPGQSEVVSFDVTSAAFRMVDRRSGAVVSTPGEFALILTNGVLNVARHTVRVEGGEVVVEPFPGT